MQCGLWGLLYPYLIKILKTKILHLLKIKRNIYCIRYYAVGNGARHKRMDPRDATSYLTTSGKSFSKYISI